MIKKIDDPGKAKDVLDWDQEGKGSLNGRLGDDIPMTCCESGIICFGMGR